MAHFLSKFKMFRGGFHHVLKLAIKNPLGFKQKNTNGKKSSLTSKVKRGEQGYILPFLSKKCIFRAENDIFLKSSFYTKIINGPKYSFLVGQKYFSVVSSKVSIFHQILPMYGGIELEIKIFFCRHTYFLIHTLNFCHTCTVQEELILFTFCWIH